MVVVYAKEETSKNKRNHYLTEGMVLGLAMGTQVGGNIKVALFMLLGAVIG